MPEQSQGNNSTATFQYQCPRCGELFDGATASKDTAVTIIDVVCFYGWSNAKNALGARGILWNPNFSQYYPHRCIDGGCGMGELIGFKVNGS